MSGQDHMKGDCWAPTCQHCEAEDARSHDHEWTESVSRQANVCPCGAVDPWHPAGFR